MKIKNILLASMIAGASLMASSAFAATVGKTVTVNLKTDLDGGYNAHFGNEFSSADATNLFSDKYMFTLASSYDSSASVTSTFLKSSTTKDLLITGFSLVQYDPTDIAHVLHTYTGNNTTNPAGAHPTDNWELTTMGLTAGSYYVKVDGQIVGNGGGTYGTDLTISAAVPEPETYGLMAAGLGLLGFVARRKKAKAAA
jgi:hypothetical protein